MSKLLQFNGLKHCNRCGELRPIEDFARHHKRPDGLQPECRECGAARYRERQAKKGRTVRSRVTAPEGCKYCPGCQSISPFANWHRNSTTRDGYAAYCKDCRKKQGEASHLKRTFGITMAERDALLEAQGGVCAICRSDKPTHTDHNHLTGELRGLLCTGCNLGLGQFRDDPQRMFYAIRYLKRHGTPAKGLAAVIDIGYWTGPSPLEANLRWHLAS